MGCTYTVESCLTTSSVALFTLSAVPAFDVEMSGRRPGHNEHQIRGGVELRNDLGQGKGFAEPMVRWTIRVGLVRWSWSAGPDSATNES